MQEVVWYTTFMKHKVIANVAMNLAFTFCLYLLNDWALRNGLEETFLTFALTFGMIYIIGNTLFILFFFRK